MTTRKMFQIVLGLGFPPLRIGDELMRALISQAVLRTPAESEVPDVRVAEWIRVLQPQGLTGLLGLNAGLQDTIGRAAP